MKRQIGLTRDEWTELARAGKDLGSFVSRVAKPKIKLGMSDEDRAQIRDAMKNQPPSRFPKKKPPLG